ncbi:hypothetical protein GU926_04340 [Nibribacter ruber]|uniref:TraB/GumN family protein n=1 Tax=Nibribacter ruber TaxID=2698458 RepID=A0A6P1NS98_9BACT|nr:DUF5694 domain-containing protein [Nibribacter ruber]QHL86706.1 hypothetical protein GU926_04340 [Nibribacter ruber]
MKKYFLFACALSVFSLQTKAQDIASLLKKIPKVPAKDKVQIMVLGSQHFGQENFYKNAPKADLFSNERQKEVDQINKLLLKYKPDMIMIENTPEEQSSVDSLYTLFKTGKIELKDIEYGRAERYQFGYNLAKQLHHDRIFGVDHYESVSNRILASGQNIDYYTNARLAFSAIGKELDEGFKAGTISLKEYLTFLNSPQVASLTYDLFYITPAKVRNSSFVDAPAQYHDSVHVSRQYIGAEFVSLFLERELKIYSNIVTTQLANKGKRLLVIMGQRHGAALPKIIANDPRYQVVPVSAYLK